MGRSGFSIEGLSTKSSSGIAVSGTLDVERGDAYADDEEPGRSGGTPEGPDLGCLERSKARSRTGRSPASEPFAERCFPSSVFVPSPLFFRDENMVTGCEGGSSSGNISSTSGLARGLAAGCEAEPRGEI